MPSPLLTYREEHPAAQFLPLGERQGRWRAGAGPGGRQATESTRALPVARLVQSSRTPISCRFNPLVGVHMGGNHRFSPLPLSPLLPFSLTINKNLSEGEHKEKAARKQEAG